MTQKDDFNQIKRDLVDKVEAIEQRIIEGNEIFAQLKLKIYGDNEANPPIPGIDARLIKLEAIETNRLQLKKEFLKLAIGSFTIALGGVIVWIFNIFKGAFTKVN